MRKQQLLALFLCSLVPWTIGNGMTPLLPVYAADLGASPSLAGYQLALAYLALAAGTLSAGWLSDRLQRRKGLIVAGGLVNIPILWLMGQVTNVWALGALLAVWCFSAGMSVTLINILTGLFAEESVRGKVFGILSLNSGLGALIGGLALGPIADGWGYPAMFVVLSLFSFLWPAIGVFLKDEAVARTQGASAMAGGEKVGLGQSFHFLFLASLAAAFAGMVFTVGRSLVMDDLGFEAAAISTTSALSEVPILPLPLLLGWLSDRVGRRQFLILGHLAATAGLLSLAVSTSQWHFCGATVLNTISVMTGAVGTALVADLVPQKALGKGLSLFGATTCIAGILGCAAAGYAIQYLGPVFTFVASALLPLVAVAFLLAIRQGSRQQESPALPLGKPSAAEPLAAGA